jgi:hypothetical protein
MSEIPKAEQLKIAAIEALAKHYGVQGNVLEKGVNILQEELDAHSRMFPNSSNKRGKDLVNNWVIYAFSNISVNEAKGLKKIMANASKNTWGFVVGNGTIRDTVDRSLEHKDLSQLFGAMQVAVEGATVQGVNSNLQDKMIKFLFDNSILKQD